MRPAALVFSIYVLAQFVWTLKHPSYGYDQFFYLGCAQSRSLPADSVLARSVREIRDHFPADRQEYFFRAPAYRAQVSTDTALYQRQLVFYRGRILYNALIRLKWAAGLPPAQSFVWLGALPAAGLALLICFWLARHFPPWAAALLAVAVAEASQVWHIADELTPDCLAQFFILAGCFAWLEYRNRLWVWGLFALALLTRPDSILFTGPIGLWVAWDGEPGSRITRALPLAGLAGLYAAVQAWAGHYSWWALFHHSFIEFLLDPANPPAFNPWQYRAIVKRALVDLPWETAPWFWACAIAAILAIRLRRPANPRAKIFFLIVLAGYAAHFLMFPSFWGRLLLGYHVALAVSAALLWSGGNGKVTGSGHTARR